MSPANLRTARKALGLTQRGLAEALHMGKWGWQTISGWEGGRDPIPADLHLKMAGLAAIRGGSVNAPVNGKRKVGPTVGSDPTTS